MKKIVSVTLAILTAMSFAACKSKETEKTPSKENPTVSESSESVESKETEKPTAEVSEKTSEKESEAVKDPDATRIDMQESPLSFEINQKKFSTSLRGTDKVFVSIYNDGQNKEKGAGAVIAYNYTKEDALKNDTIENTIEQLKGRDKTDIQAGDRTFAKFYVDNFEDNPLNETLFYVWLKGDELITISVATQRDELNPEVIDQVENVVLPSIEIKG